MPPHVIEPMPPDPPQKNPPIVHLTHVDGMHLSSHPTFLASASIVPRRAPASTRATPPSSERILSSRVKSMTTPP